MNNIFKNTQPASANVLATTTNFIQTFMYLAANLKITEGQTIEQSTC